MTNSPIGCWDSLWLTLTSLTHSLWPLKAKDYPIFSFQSPRLMANTCILIGNGIRKPSSQEDINCSISIKATRKAKLQIRAYQIHAFFSPHQPFNFSGTNKLLQSSVFQTFSGRGPRMYGKIFLDPLIFVGSNFVLTFSK